VATNTVGFHCEEKRIEPSGGGELVIPESGAFGTLDQGAY